MNLSKLEEYFTKEITPSELANELQDTIFELIYLYGAAPEGTLMPSVLSNMVYRLKSLLEVLRETDEK